MTMTTCPDGGLLAGSARGPFFPGGADDRRLASGPDRKATR